MTDVTMASQGETAGVCALHPAEIDALRWQPLDRTGNGNVQQKVLWRHGSAVAGLLRLEPAAVQRRHTHKAAQHHVWVLDGQAWVADVPVGPGSYVHVPAGVPHATAAGPGGCTMFYLFLPTEG
jgi:quercetin dioxygenase-like cupin family protein